MAPAAGFEPATKWLTATYSTAELCRKTFRSLYRSFKPKLLIINLLQTALSV